MSNQEPRRVSTKNGLDSTDPLGGESGTGATQPQEATSPSENARYSRFPNLQQLATFPVKGGFKRP